MFSQRFVVVCSQPNKLCLSQYADVEEVERNRSEWHDECVVVNEAESFNL